MNISYLWDEAFQARHVVVEMPANHDITLTTNEALRLLEWLESQRENLQADEQRKREHRRWLESERDSA
jgi:hypothetical protein